MSTKSSNTQKGGLVNVSLLQEMMHQGFVHLKWHCDQKPFTTLLWPIYLAGMYLASRWLVMAQR